MTTSVHDRLKARWAKTGGGPELEARLKAAKAELRRRGKASQEQAKASQERRELRAAIDALREMLVADGAGRAAVTRSALKAAIRRAEATGAERAELSLIHI